MVGAELNHYRSVFWMLQDPRNDLTVVADYERRSGRRLLFDDGIFNVESISI